MPTEEAITAALSRVGMQYVRLNRDDFTVRYDREGVMLELGAIGKGYAVDRAVDLLREYEIKSALLHGGTSTIYGLGAPPDADAWTVAIQHPSGLTGAYLAQAELHDAALSVSAPHGKWFEQSGKKVWPCAGSTHRLSGQPQCAGRAGDGLRNRQRCALHRAAGKRRRLAADPAPDLPDSERWLPRRTRPATCRSPQQG